MSDNSVFQQRTLNVQQVTGGTLLGAISGPDGIRLFFTSDTPQEHIQADQGARITQLRSIGNAPVLDCKVKEGQPLSILLDKAGFRVKPREPETDLFKGLNTGFAIRNGETPEITLDWLNYHTKHHGMNAALILDRAKPGTDNSYARNLKKAARKIKGLERLVLLDSPVPLGKPDLPPEAHPFNVPGAPGKDRMDIPAADPWLSPLGELQIFELVRARFLNTARAVMNIEMYDLLVIGKGANVFDRAVNAGTGCIELHGHQVYPWRVRSGQPAHFGDHICRQFDAKGTRRRWCVAPDVAGKKSVWRLIRVVGTAPTPHETAPYLRCMALRHPTGTVSKIVPKTSLIEDRNLLDLSQRIFRHKPVRTPEEKSGRQNGGDARTCIVTTMKNEGPFILEWLAYHRAIGVQDFLIYTNDCTDGTDTMLQMLQEKGYVQHRENPFRNSGLKPQHAALQAADNEPMVRNADWLICMDVDEFINIKCGDGTLDALFGAVGDANMISLTWRLFGNSDIHEFRDDLIISQFTRCAEELIRKPHQAWGFKTLYQNIGIFKKMGVHRPKGLKPQLWEKINWVNGSGKPMPANMYRNGWRSTINTYGYDLVQLNHYAVRSAESFLVKRDRGRVNHVDRDQGLVYWFRMNNNAQEERTIQRMIPAVLSELEKLMSDPEIAAAHAHSVEKHQAKIRELKADRGYLAFYRELTDPKLEKLSRMHSRFGRNVFLQGPGVIPDEIAEKDPDEEFFFTVKDGETAH